MSGLSQVVQGTMKACILRTPGNAQSVKVEECPIPEVGDEEVWPCQTAKPYQVRAPVPC